MNEKQLVEALKRGEKWAYEKLYSEYAPRIGSVAKSFLGADDVDDVVQEVMIRIFKGIKKFRGDSQLSTWIHKITVNVCKDMLMKYKKRREILTDFSENEEGPYYQPKAHEDVFRDTFNEITIEKVLKAIERLSPEDRLLIKLRDIDELSYEEISKIMGKPLGTVKSRLHYARKRLREILEEGEKSVERSPQQNTRW